VSHHIN